MAVDLASRAFNADKIACLVVENTFTSIPDMARQIIPWRGLKYLPFWFHKNKVLLAGHSHSFPVTAECRAQVIE